MSTEENPILEKIRKLLRAAQSGERGASQAEVEAAMVMAQRLAAKHNINLAEVDAVEEVHAGEPIVDEAFTPERSGGGPVESKLPVVHGYLVSVLQDFFGVQVLWGKRWTDDTKNGGRVYRPTINVVGRKSQVAIAIYVYHFLYQEAQRLWREDKKKNERELHERNSFYLGLFEALSWKLTETKKAVEWEEQLALEERLLLADKPAGSTSVAMVLIGEAEKIKAKVVEGHPRVKYVDATNRSVTSYDAKLSGREAGRKININPALK